MQTTEPGSASGQTAPPAGSRDRRRRRGLILGGALLAVAAGAVVLLRPPDPSSEDGPAAAPRPSPSASLGPRSPAGSDPASTATPGAPVTGAVEDGGVHSGDLRFFLLPVPRGAESYGDRAGDVLTLDEAAVAYYESVRVSMRGHGFRGGAHRAYRTADGKREVDVQLVRFGSAASARDFAGEHHGEGPRVTLPGDSRARAHRLDSAAAESTDAFMAVSYEGDTVITLTVTGSARSTPQDTAELLDRQYARLRTGR